MCELALDALERLFFLAGSMEVLLGVVLGLLGVLEGLVSGGLLLGVLEHLLDFGLGDSTTRFDSDVLLLLVGAAVVPGSHVDETVRVDAERDIDLGNTALQHGKSGETHGAEHLVGAGLSRSPCSKSKMISVWPSWTVVS